MPLLSAPRSQLLEDLPFYVRRLGITHLGLVPSLIEATLNAAREDEESMAIRYIASGGEKISDSVGINISLATQSFIFRRFSTNGPKALKLFWQISMVQAK